MKIDNKILKAINEGIRKGLLAFDDIEFDKLNSNNINQKISRTIEEQETKNLLIDKFVNNIEIEETEIVNGLKQYINSHPNINVGIIKANDEDHLKELVKTAIEFLGNEANLNWIDVSNIEDMSSMFFESQFNGNISNWDVSSVTNMCGMFERSQFNGDISNWDVSNVTNMCEMFQRSQFNRDISNWNVSGVINMESMFAYSIFNNDLSNWDVSNVENMYCMFYLSQFNRDISNWNVSRVTNMGEMFAYSKYNNDLSHWNISNVETMRDMFLYCPIEKKYRPKFK